MKRVVLLALVAGCSSILGIEDLGGPNNPGVDGSVGPDVIVNERITRMLDVRIFDQTMGDTVLANAPIDFVRMPDRVILQSGSTDSAGRIVMSLPTNGSAIDGYFRISPGGNGLNYPETSLYELPLVGDGATAVSVLTDAALDGFSAQLEPRAANSAFVFVFVAQPGGDINTGGRSGIRIQAGPNERVYYEGPAGGMGFDPNATETGMQGNAIIVNALAMPHALTAIEAVTNRTVGSRTVDIMKPRTVHFFILPTTP